MADLVSPIVVQLIDKLRSQSLEVAGVNSDLKELENTLTKINQLLADAVTRSSLISKNLSPWLRSIKDAVYDADDLLDEFEYNALSKNLHPHRKSKVRDFFLPNRSAVFSSFNMAHKIKQVNKRLEELARMGDLGGEEGGSPSGRRSLDKVLLQPPDDSQLLSQSIVYGRNEDAEILVNLLLSVDADKDLSIAAIVGMGGVGKTTLAQLVYGDARINNHFELKMWAYVGDDFDVKNIVHTITESSSSTGRMLKNSSSSQLEDLEQIIRDEVLERRFLLVLDDVWNEDIVKWERLRRLLRGGRHGSKILVTTCAEMVAKSMNTVMLHRINVLPPYHSWCIFRERAFGIGRIEESPHLIQIGKELVKKCAGLPLATKLLGGLMATKQTEQEWLDVLNSEIWNSSASREEGIMPAIRLSYDNLPSTLKQCFLYLSLFPKGYEIKRSELIKLWIAEGFIPVSTEEQLSLESTGNTYFNSLLLGSFISDEKKDKFGQIVSCKMHDLLHDFACYIASDLNSTNDRSTGSLPLYGRYYSNTLEHGTKELVLNEAKKLRSLHLFSESPLPFSLEELGPISNLKCLRVLSASGVKNSMKFVDRVGRLKHLRFLDLSYWSFELLPNSITHLYCLQTLRLKGCRELRELPKDTQNLRSLRHLDITDCDKLINMPTGLGRLTDLRTLPSFVVSNVAGHTILELQNLNLISGELTIRYLRNVKDPREAMAANLHAKAQLLSLELDWAGSHEEHNLPLKEIVIEENLLENLQPHHNLVHFAVTNYNGKRLPDWLGTMLPNLKNLQLHKLKRCESLMSVGSTFSSLEFLSLCDLPNLREWFVPENGLLSLENLKIVRCPLLRIQSQLPSSVTRLEIDESSEELLAAGGSLQGLSKLRYLYIAHMTASSISSWWKGMQYLTSLEELEIRWCHQLEHFPEGVLLLSSLQTLVLHHNDKLKSLEDVLGSRKQPRFCDFLRHLRIENCAELTDLPDWMGDLTSLQSLEIKWCNNMAVLLSRFQQIRNLSQLTIVGCPLLDRQCKMGTGTDWHKIAHIPNIYIGQTSEPHVLEIL